jgi:hypothetical protein
MQNFELSLNEEINIYINNNLTPNELFLLRLLFLAIDGDQKLLVNYLSNVSNSKQLLRETLCSLQEKKVINSDFKIPREGESLNVKNIPFNKNFMKMYIRESNEIGKEFFEAYPSFINIRGKMISIKNFTRAGLFSPEEFCLFYAKSIKNSGYTHERIMKALEFGKENDLINYSILEFIASQKYKELEYLQDSGGDLNGYKNSELL